MDEHIDQPRTDPSPAARDLIEVMLPQFRQTISAIKAVFDTYIGLSPVRLILLEQMNEAQEISQAEIQRRLGVGGAVVTRIIKQMEAEGIITRRHDPADNRFTLVRLTEVGRRRQAEAMSKIHLIEMMLLAGLGVEEVRCMHASLAHIQKNAENLMKDPVTEKSAGMDLQEIEPGNLET